MSPRNTAEGAARTRAAIVARAMDRASVEGLDAITIGELAGDLGLSKAGVVGPFGSKQELQLAVLDRAIEDFTAAVWEPVASLPPGRERLVAAIERWITYLSHPPLPGGCFFTASSTEWDGREGPVRDAVAAAQGRWLRTLTAEAKVAVREGEVSAGIDPGQLAFDLSGVAMALNQAVQLFHDRRAAARARRSVARLLEPA
jgi:AcrR family transcriptional regulator